MAWFVVGGGGGGGGGCCCCCCTAAATAAAAAAAAAVVATAPKNALAHCCRCVSVIASNLPLCAHMLQEVWLHATNFGWHSPQLWDHIFRLTNIQITTKQNIEDVIASVSDATARDQKRYAHMSPERLFFVYSRSKRLQKAGAHYINPVALGDMHSRSAYTFPRDRRHVFGIQQGIKQQAPKMMKQLCASGCVVVITWALSTLEDLAPRLPVDNGCGYIR